MKALLSHIIGQLPKVPSIKIEYNLSPISGGCISSAFKLRVSQQNYFLKVQSTQGYDNFSAESHGLSLLNSAGVITAPTPILIGNFDSYSYLLMDWLVLDGPKNFRNLGRQLAELHRKTTQQVFGLDRHNFIGTSPQDNDPDMQAQESWAQFFCERRIKPQLNSALVRHNFSVAAEKILECCYEVLADHRPKASLLHGDLWSGNIGFDQEGSAVIFDPACYYGDRETDIAYTELFGGFSQDFYKAYQDEWPLDQGHETRKKIYNLYHLLNHLNLFGSSYFEQCDSLIRSIESA